MGLKKAFSSADGSFGRRERSGDSQGEPFSINNDLNVKTLVPILFVIPNLFRNLAVVEWGLDKHKEEYYFDEKDLGL